MNYYLYNPVSFSVRSELKRGAKQHGLDLSGKPWQAIWIEWLTQGVILADIATPIVFLENAWLKEPLCLLPDSFDLITQLLNTNFEGQINALRPFAELFTIALPKDARFNQEIIQGLFVAYLSPNRKNTLLTRFNADYGTRVQYETTGADPQLSICYADPNGAGRIVLTVDLWKLEWVLSAENIEEYRQLTGVNSDSILTHGLTPNEQQTQFEVLKFVIAFIVYISAHDNAVTFMHNIKMPSAEKNAARVSINVVHRFKAINSVIPHYRNLRHARFYQGKWATWETGSRWIPVNMETVKVDEV